MEEKIDMVIAYVNNQDIVWRKTYIDFCRKNNLNNKVVDLVGARFGGINFIDYQLKLVEKNMPWINTIHLLLSNIEQKPKYIPSNCKVVLHHQFIPYKYLPTFNSTTIEMFLWNIPNLSEKFIYANDDMLPIGKLEPSDFFDESGKIKINWREREFSFGVSVYGYQCYNNCVFLARELKQKWQDNRILCPEHSFTPMIRKHCKEAYNTLSKHIEKHIRAFRTIYQFNQYIYPLYEYLKYGTLDTSIDFLYTELSEDFDFNHQILCVNCEYKKEYVNKFLEGIKEICK